MRTQLQCNLTAVSEPKGLLHAQCLGAGEAASAHELCLRVPHGRARCAREDVLSSHA